MAVPAIVYAQTYPSQTFQNVTSLGTATLNDVTIGGSLSMTGGIPPASLSPQAANTILGNVTGTTAAPTAVPVPGCNGAAQALQSTNGSGFGCNSNIATAGANANITSLTGLTTSLSTGQGGTGLANLTVHGVVLGEGTAPVAFATPSTLNYALLSTGASSDPTFQPLTAPIVNYNQGNANAVTRTVANRLQERISVMDFGCDNTGSTDDYTCFSNAVAALPASGGVINLPPGVYYASAFPSLAGKINIIFRGAGGLSAGAQTGTEIKIGATGSGAFINAPGSVGVQFEDIQFVYDSSSFTGWIMSFGNNGSDAAFAKIRRCAFLSNSSSLFTAGGINMDKTIVWTIEDSVFSGLLEAIQGYTVASGDYSNVGTIARNQFGNTRYAPISGGGQAWVIANNNFEGFNNGTAGNSLAGSLSMTSSVSMLGLQYVGNWHGDVNTAGGTWVTVSGGGIGISSNFFGANGSGSNAISANAVQGLRVTANYFTSLGTALSFDTAGNTGVEYASNQFVSVSNQIGSPGNYSGMLLNSGNLSVTGTGAMPLYNTIGTGANAPHMVTGSVSLSSGTATVTLSGSSVFSSSATYACTGNDTTSAAAVKISLTSGSAFALTGTGTDTVQFICAGS